MGLENRVKDSALGSRSCFCCTIRKSLFEELHLSPHLKDGVGVAMQSLSAGSREGRANTTALRQEKAWWV